MTDRLLSEILELLRNEDKNHSVRYNRFWKYHRPDNNIFSLASSLFILQEVKEGLNDAEQQKTESIQKLITNKYQAYKNKDNRNSYNFYPTRPSQHFSNGYLMQHFDHFRLPDDIDDTALISFTQSITRADAEQLQMLTDSFSQKLKDGSVYNTWYGKNMPKEQDACAILNLLYVFFQYDLGLTHTGQNSLRYLKAMIPYIESSPFKVARHYGKPALILYQYARFMNRFTSILDTEKQEIISIIKRQMLIERNGLHRVMLTIALMKLEKIKIDLDLSGMDFKDGYTFIGAPLAPFQNPLAQKMSKNKLTHIFWKSEIHIKAILIEYLYYYKKSAHA